MAKPSKGKIRTVSIIIKWHEEETETAASNPTSANSGATSLRPRIKEETTQGHGAQINTQTQSVQQPRKRLLPSDRVVLDTLRARLPRGEQVTTLVRTRELMAACEISRRQVQICLRRLSEKGFIKRLLEDADPGNTDGYRYYLSKDALSG
jgi:hypothetical protein